MSKEKVREICCPILEKSHITMDNKGLTQS